MDRQGRTADDLSVRRQMRTRTDVRPAHVAGFIYAKRGCGRMGAMASARREAVVCDAFDVYERICVYVMNTSLGYTRMRSFGLRRIEMSALKMESYDM